MSGAPTALGGAVVGTSHRGVTTTALALLTALGAACGSETAIMGVGDAVASLTITSDTDGPGGAPAAAGPVTLEVGESVGLSATGTNALGLAVSGVPVTWSSSAPSVVHVGSDGVATALAAGSADVYAAVDGISATVRIVVTSTVTVPAPAT